MPAGVAMLSHTILDLDRLDDVAAIGLALGQIAR
jgi:hypothetical protein